MVAANFLVHQLRAVALDRVHRVPVIPQQRLELLVRYPSQHRRVGDLVSVQVQDRQHRAVGGRAKELVGVPAAGQRPGCGLAVPDHAGHDQVLVVERRPVGVGQRVAEFAALVNSSSGVVPMPKQPRLDVLGGNGSAGSGSRVR